MQYELLHSVEQLLGQFGHGTGLSADKGTDLNSKLVGFLDRHTGKDGRGKRACEAVAGTYRVVHFHLGCRLIALHAGRKDVAAVGATGEHEHLQVVLAEDEIALVLDVETGVAEETTDGDKFLIVDLQDVASFETLLYDLLGVEVLAQVDVEDLQTAHRRGVEEAVDRVARDLVALSQ